jgi:hypothetical protein
MPRGRSGLWLPQSLAAMLLSSLVLVSGQNDACAAVPAVPGLDQSPSDRSQYGKCTDAIDSHIKPNSNWCNFGKMGYWPAGPSRQARRCMKWGRLTVYRGPIWGSEPAHKGACNATLVGSNQTAMVAVSTKYLKTAQHGWVEDKGSCGKCMCVHIRGVDDQYNTGVSYYHAKQYFGLTFLAQVSGHQPLPGSAWALQLLWPLLCHRAGIQRLRCLILQLPRVFRWRDGNRSCIPASDTTRCCRVPAA